MDTRERSFELALLALSLLAGVLGFVTWRPAEAVAAALVVASAGYLSFTYPF